MRARRMLPIVAVIGLVAACGDDDGGLFANVDDTVANDDTAASSPTTDAPATTVVSDDTLVSPPSAPSPPTSDPLDSPDDGGSTPFTFPPLPDPDGGSSGHPSPSGGGSDIDVDDLGAYDEGMIVDEFARAFSLDGMFTEDEGRCVAQTMIDTLGLESFLQAVVDTEGDVGTWPPQLQETLIDSLWDCVDFRELLVEEFIGSGTTRSQAECIWSALDDEEWKEFFALAALTGEDLEFDADFEARVAHCEFE